MNLFADDKVDPSCLLSAADLLEAIGHLHKALELLIYVNDQIIDQTVDSLEVLEKLSDGWLEVNKCRIYTERSVYFEELLIPAMGLINDAKLMLESLVEWKLGMTLYGKISILTCIRGAILDGIRPSLIDLESCLSQQ